MFEHENLARALGQLIWGTDTSAFYRDIARLSELSTDAKVLDIPCGGRRRLPWPPPQQELDYVAADLSPVMLRQAHAEADRRGLHELRGISVIKRAGLRQDTLVRLMQLGAVRTAR